jgi:predicted TIM-barrel fold metal-dependent hydrolase
MIVDFQHHYSPRELFPEDLGDKKVVQYDERGVPKINVHSLLYDLDEHIRMMDMASIDVAVLTSPHGMRADLEGAHFINDKMRDAVDSYPGRFIALGHANPLDGEAGMAEIARCAEELGFPGVVVQSELKGHCLDDPEFEPFWEEIANRGLYVFIHPVLDAPYLKIYDADDLSRALGREISLIATTVRLINGGVFDRHPDLVVHMAHLAGGIGGILGRLRSFQDKAFWATGGNERHGRRAEHDIDHYLGERMVFDTAGFSGALSSVRAALCELDAARIVFGSDYPQEIRAAERVRDFVNDIRSLGADGEAIVAGNVGLLLPPDRFAA